MGDFENFFFFFFNREVTNNTIVSCHRDCQPYGVHFTLNILDFHCNILTNKYVNYIVAQDFFFWVLLLVRFIQMYFSEGK